MENELDASEIKLSILVCSVLGRRKTFLPRILELINEQTENRNDVEVIVVIDNKKRMLGTKRNDLVNMAQGEFVCFVDDDDIIRENFVSELINAIEKNSSVDVINYEVAVSLNGGEFKTCFYSKEFKHDYNTEEAYFRIPNHLMAFKKSVCKLAPYKPIIRGEDSAFSKDVLQYIKSEYNIKKTLYEYRFDQSTTETQFKIKHKNK